MSQDKIDMGVDFEIAMFSELSKYFTPLSGIKDRDTRIWEYRNLDITPDLTFGYEGNVFHVDCHYRSRLHRNAYCLDYHDVYRMKMKCFLKVDEPIFVAYGVGGDPYCPEMMIFERLDEIGGNRIPAGRFMRFCSNFERLSMDEKIRLCLPTRRVGAMCPYTRVDVSDYSDASYV